MVYDRIRFFSVGQYNGRKISIVIPLILLFVSPKNNLGYGFREFLLGTIAIAEARQCAVIVPKNIDNFPDQKQIQDGTIDIWWIIHDGGLLFLIAFLLKRNKVWARCRIRLFTVAQLEDNSVEMKRDLEQYMYQLRIEAEVNVVEMVRQLFESI